MFRALCYISCFLILVTGRVQGQKEDYDEEKDNEFPLENQENDLKEGSGNGLNLFEELPPITSENEEFPNEMVTADVILCPDVCTCSQESSIDGDVKIAIDCSSKSLTELPQNIDQRVTDLLFQDNKLEAVPKAISIFKNLRIVNFNDNKIMDFEYGSISVLPRLCSLKLANNRLLDIPRDLKNGIELNELEELDLSGNDIRETIEANSFEHMQNLKVLILPFSSSKLVADICHSHQNLEYVCTVSCEDNKDDCGSLGDDNSKLDSPTDETPVIDDSHALLIGDIDETPIEVSSLQPMLDVVNVIESYDVENAVESTIERMLGGFPGEISLASTNGTNYDNSENDEVESTPDPELSRLSSENSIASTTETNESTGSNGVNNEAEQTTESVISIIPSESSRNVNLNSTENDSVSPVKNEAPEDLTASSEAAKDKSVSQQAGVDNRIIAGVIAGMVLVVAGVAIKKNWTTIRNKFRPRTIPSYSGQQANGASPEETPLKETSPA